MEKSTLSKIEKSTLSKINWVNIFPDNNIFIGLLHRPPESCFKLLKETIELDCLVTVQSKREHVDILENLCKKYEINWLHVDLEGANLPLLKNKKSQKTIKEGLSELLRITKMENNKKILIHCAAGIHRTGIITYSLLRLLGYDAKQSKETLQKLREATFKGVGEHRLQYAEDEIIKSFG